jgi:hypothetical protein
VEGISVRFVVMHGGGQVQHPNALTDAQGRASAGSWTLGAEPGANEVAAVAGGLDMRFRAHAAHPPFRITVRFLAQPLAEHEQAVNRAVRRWESVVTSDLRDARLRMPAHTCFLQQPALDEVVDDLVLFVDLGAMDGPGGYLGEAGPCSLRSDDLMPLMGYIKIDAEDLSSPYLAGYLDDLLLHELGHVLGVGTLWLAKGLLSGVGGEDPRVQGVFAGAAYHELGGSDALVPAENTGGPVTRDVHWRESVFGHELMTGYINEGENPLSALTVATLRDLGYDVDTGAARTYQLQSGAATARIRLHELERVVQPRFTVDAQGRTGVLPR